MSLPPAPRADDSPALTPSSQSRRCSGCSSPLSPMGPRPLRTAAGVGMPESVLLLEMFWCAHCGKVEFFSAR
ncbi:MAG: hypothetical protein L3K19_07115 [Thermoplasmata archaeon]|nr:hypothetical protein [Thermoplasmata archaeon]